MLAGIPARTTGALIERREKRLEEDGWELESAEARHAESPSTFWIPPKQERHEVRPGQAVKLLFRIAEEAGSVDRMWVYVTTRIGEWYQGWLQNDPGAEVDLGPGSVIWFRAEHIADIDTPPRDYEPRSPVL